MSDLSFHVRQFAPAAEGEELQHREALLIARGYCSDLLAKRIPDRAYDLAAEAREIAERFAFAPVPTARLRIARDCARHLVMAAFLSAQLDEEEGGR